MTSIQKGKFVHVVATLNTRTGESHIRYVNPSTTTIQSDAPPDPHVELVVTDATGAQLHREAVVVRRPSCEGGQPGDVALIQADLPYQLGMKAVSLVVDGKESSRYESGGPPPASPAAGISLHAGASPHRRQLSLKQASALVSQPGVSYTVQVLPDTGGPWNTIAVGRPTPVVELDRNQFPGAHAVEVKIMRTTGFEEELLAHENVKLFP